MLNIFLTNLGKYNEGELIGEWVELPCDDFEEVLERIGISDEPDEYGRYYEEYFITDYETDVNGLKVGEYDNLEDLNELAEAIEEDPERAAALIDMGYTSPEEIRRHIDDVIYITTCKPWDNEDYEIGYYYAKELGCLDIPEEIEMYFDFEAYGRDIRIDGSFYTADSGNIYEIVA